MSLPEHVRSLILTLAVCALLGAILCVLAPSL